LDGLHTPKRIAERLHVSTTTLRRYEEQGLIPDVSRTASKRRCYTNVHMQAFVTIRSLLKGYDIPVVYDAMRRIKQGRTVDALWLLNEQLSRTQAEKQRVEAMMRMLRQADFSQYRSVKVTDSMSIGEVAALAGVKPSAIRHWEQEGLIRSERNRDNGYRMYTRRELKKIIVISSLRRTIYYIENMRQLLDDLDSRSPAAIERSFQLALEKLNGLLALQFQGIAEVMAYVGMLNACKKRED